MTHDLTGKVALITGAGGEKGIGRAIALRLAQEGADIIVSDITMQPYTEQNPNWGGLSEVVREVEQLERSAISIVADITDSSQVEGMVEEGLERFGKIDILVANAGARPGRDRRPVVELEEEAWDLVQNTNVKGTFLCCKSVAQSMIERNTGGKIIVMSSTAGKRGVARYAAYCSSKFALIGFTQSLALELAPYSINVNAICPALTNTERIGFIADEIAPTHDDSDSRRLDFLEKNVSQIPLGRITKTSDVASMAAYLASADSDFLTGLSISVAGGSEMR